VDFGAKTGSVLGSIASLFSLSLHFVMLKTIHQLYEILDNRTRVHLGLMIVPMLAITLLEVLSIGLVIPVIQVLLLGEEGGTVTKIVLAILPEAAAKNPGPWVTALFAVLFVTKNFLLLVMIYVVNWVVSHKTALYVENLFSAYMSRPMEFHFQTNSSKMMLDVTSGVGSCLETIRISLLMALDLLLMIGAFILLLSVEPIATLFAAGILLAVGVLFYFITSPVFRYWGEATLTLDRDIIKWINQTFNGIRDVKLMRAEGFLSRIIEENSLRRAHFHSLASTAIHIPRLLIESVVVIGFLLIVMILLQDKQSSEDVITVLGLFSIASLRLMPSLNRLLSNAALLRRAAAHIEQIHQALTLDVSSPHEEETGIQKDAFSFRNSLEIQDLFYRYPTASGPALNDLSFSIKKGESVGFIGASGAGKSTLIDIVLGLIVPVAGRVLVDGKNIAENTRGWQANIGYVPQTVFLMDDTLRRNIAFGVAEENIDDARIQDVLKLAELETVVAGLPDGVETVVGEFGSRLSGGQRQRVAIARALYWNPDVLVFDEATSSLDNQTEQEISAAINKLAGEKTILIIAHRLSTLKGCDKIVHLKDGRLEKFGSYTEIIGQGADHEFLETQDT
jgi:ABC-type multidrug transport system fused ATPase/permease subunit